MPFRSLWSVPTDTSLTTFSLFRFSKGSRWQALKRMGQHWLTAPLPSGMTFGKMLGSGKNGFSLIPDFSQYALLATWESVESAEAFYANHPLLLDYAGAAEEVYSLQMIPLMAHGQWQGCNPFQTATKLTEVPADIPVVVLTRATIRLQKLYRFWQHVPQAQQAMQHSNGLLMAFGIGEVPLLQQATLSIWKSGESMKEFAYGSQQMHRRIVEQTRREQWYGEALFARFCPIASQGSYQGRDLLAESYNEYLALRREASTLI
ncbi:MAG: hypothetical protein H7Y04_11720 [Verrucomicrobia bacterium]|nr:hypothetical protein [Cytophagales bacterium]